MERMPGRHGRDRLTRLALVIVSASLAGACGRSPIHGDGTTQSQNPRDGGNDGGGGGKGGSADAGTAGHGGNLGGGGGTTGGGGGLGGGGRGGMGGAQPVDAGLGGAPGRRGA